MKTIFLCLVVFEIALFSGSDDAFGQSARPKDPQQSVLITGRSGARRGRLSTSGAPEASLANKYRIRTGNTSSPPVVGKLLRVPSGYPTIQTAIDSAIANDTVLVAEGLYYENIRFRGKSIVVASAYAMTGDTSHISRTIIDGSQTAIPDSGSVVYIVNGEDTNAVLCGFTIRGGTGTRRVSSGFVSREGGGVLVYGSSAKLIYNTISGNTVTHQFPFGGGVEANGCASLIMNGNTVKNNKVYSPDGQAAGGGMCLEYSTEAVLLHNTFELNVTHTDGPYNAVGGGLYCSDGTYLIEHNTFERNTALAPNSTSLQTLGGGVVAAYVMLDFRENRVIGNVVQGSGVTKVIGGGICLEVDDQDGIRDMRVTGNYIAHNQVINGSYPSGGGGIGARDERPLIENNIIVHNTAPYGGGVFAFIQLTTAQGGGPNVVRDAPVLINNTIVSNRATTTNGGAVASFGAWTPKVANTIAWGDTASSEIFTANGSGLTVLHSDIRGGYPGSANIDADPMFADSTYQLSDSSRCIGAGIDSVQIGGVWYRAPAVCFDGTPRPNPVSSLPDMGACENHLPYPLNSEVVLLFPRNLSTIISDSCRLLWTHPGIPAWEYRLVVARDSSYSPSSLVLTEILHDTSLVVGGLETDGSYWWRVDHCDREGGIWIRGGRGQQFRVVITGVSDRAGLTEVFALNQNYPNPFNPATVISYEVPADGQVTLKVYDLLGREVASLVNRFQRTGRYSVTFDASRLASGVYVCSLASGGHTAARRMLLMK